MAVAVEDITPSLTAIASYIRNRTLNRQNKVLGTFADDTLPTEEDAERIAVRAARYVALRLGTVTTTWSGNLNAVATDVAALYAALQIETGYYGDGSGEEQGPIDQLGRMFREQLNALIATARDNQPGAWRIHSIPIVSTNSPAAYREPWFTNPDLEPEQLVNGPDDDDDI